MATKPHVGWLGPACWRELDCLVGTRVPLEQRPAVQELLRPFLEEVPQDDDWLERLRAALAVLAPALASALQERMKTALSEIRWAELTGAVIAEWPDHPAPLDDWQVLHRLECLARQAAAEQSSSLRREVVEDAPAILLQAFTKFDRSRPFNAWARMVLRKYAISLWRRSRRIRVNSDPMEEVVSPSFSPATEDDLAEALHAFRKLCDRAEFSPSATGPDRYAAFILDARLRLLERLVHFGTAFLEQHFPLRPWERPRQVCRAWPGLGQLWDWIAVHPRVPGTQRIEVVQQACLALAPGLDVEGIGPLWNTWINRAKDQVKRHFEAHVEALLFIHLFPDRVVH